MSFADLARQLTARAATIAEARTALARRTDPQRWRDARLLWPDFTRRRG
ncbi:hypothetical protein K3172_01090 [Qipengyuania sp. 6B39]|nr:hypothetical protein [Qipengyuania proteolytica]MBX7494445.1 hypothetical protein [Qipengyuania proteolytica]